MSDMMSSIKLKDVFIKGSHHNNVTVLSLVQNLYPKGKFSRDIRLNLHYVILMKSFALESQINRLGMDTFKRYPTFFFNAYKKATISKFSYLVLVLHPEYENLWRVTSQIFPSEYLSVFIPENGKAILQVYNSK